MDGEVNVRRIPIAIILISGFALSTGPAVAFEPGRPSRHLHLNAATIDTDNAPNLKLARTRPVGRQTYLVQFDHPLSTQDRLALGHVGLPIGDYLTDTAYAVRANAAELTRLAARADVRWIGPFARAWKLDPELDRRPFVTTDRLALRAQARARVVITLFADRPVAAALAAIQAIPGASLHYTEQVAGNETIVVTIPAAATATLAGLDDVQYIEDAPELTLRNNTTRWIVQTNLAGVTPFYANSLTGTGQVIGILDSRIDYNHCAFYDAANPIGPLHRKILAYNAPLGAASHGTFVAGVATGDAGAFDDNRGVAYGAKLVYGDFTTAFTETGVYTNLTTHHSQGARIHTNSWGNDGTTSYDGLCRGIDAFAYDNEDDLVLFAVTNQSSLRNPENAKNLLAVAACGDAPNQEFHCKGGIGPTADGRRKPEIFAPGCGVSSAQNGTTCGVQSLSVGVGGTSYACPAVAGAATLVRQYFVNGFYPTGTATPTDTLNPSAALIKAVLLNSSVDMTGVAGYPSNQEGWGRIQADLATYFAGDSRRLHVLADPRNAAGLSPSQQMDYPFAVNGSSEQLRLTLVWTDPPASAATGSGNAAVNDLDLEVLSPGGLSTYLGNVFSAGISVTGGTADTRNNVEQVHLNSPTPGLWTARVRATSVPVGTQGFALIAAGQVGQVLAPPTVASITPADSDIDTFVEVTDLAGAGFQPGATVKLTRSGYPDIPTENVIVTSPTKITCGINLTEAPIGPWNVVVTNPDTQSGSLANGFTVTGPYPTVSSITPGSGAAGAIVNVTNLAGTNFVNGATVKLTRTGQTDIAATAVAVASPTQITCTLNLAGAAVGAWNVVVTNPDLRSGSLTDGFTITLPPPTVSSIAPNSGTTGTTVNITSLVGTGFEPGAGVKLTRSGHADILGFAVMVLSPTEITCSLDLTGAAAGLWNVVVTNPDAQSASLPAPFSVTLPPPTVSAITPSAGPTGTTVTVTDLAGTNFIAGATVKLTRSGQPDIVGGSVIVASPSQITCSLNLTGAEVGLWTVVVTNPDSQSAGLPDAFSVTLPPPTVASITPAAGIIDTTVNITNLAGTAFVDGAGVRLTRAGQPDIPGTSVVVDSPTQITCSFDLAGALVGAWNVVVINPDAQSGVLPAGFSVTLPPPLVSSITPATGQTDTTVDITNLAGNNFVAGAGVKLTRAGQPDINAASVVVAAPTEITCSIDLAGAAAGVWNVVVTNPDAQSGTLVAAFTVTLPPPAVTSITPDSGHSGSIVSIASLAGTGFQPGAGVRLQRTGQPDIDATGVVVESGVEILCTFNLAGADLGPWDVVVTNPDAQSASLPGAFSVTLGPPVVSQITPNTGAIGAIVSVTSLLGSNFQPGAIVILRRIGSPDILAGSVMVLSATHITCEFELVGASIGAWDVVVVNPDTQLGALPTGFQIFESCLKGDMTGDGLVNGADIQRFLDDLVTSGGTPPELCAGDVGALRDGLIGEDDLPAFADCILAGGCS